MRTEHALLAALPALALAGCGAPHLKTLHTAEQALIGEDADILAHCIGEPLEIREVSGTSSTRLYRYSSAQSHDAEGRLLSDPAPDPERDASACVFDIRVRDGRIVSIAHDNRAGWGFGRIKRCSAVVERCVDAR
ncbi:hypothetical protein [Thiorhodococcus fuscus]|uniref:Lipoprotein transmembrane n=1 Tax=Thiorhodococcus fuscus TaxID=527200 RepID=A0ABW4YA49_9GAMM